MDKILLVLWPLFALITMGFVLRRSTIFTADFWPSAEKLNYFILFPALLINSLATAPLNNPKLPYLASAILCVLAISSVLVLGCKYLFKIPIPRFGAHIQGITRFNTYLGLAIVADLFGKEGIAIAAVIMAVLVPSCNVIAVLSLSSGQKVSAKQILLPIIKNPLIISCVVGVLLNISPVGLPFGSDQFLKLLAAASLPLGLICIGAALQTSTLRNEFKPIMASTLLRLLLMPILALTVAGLFSLPNLETILLVLFFAIPTAPTAYILTRQLNGDSQLMAGIITLQTVAAVFTLPIVLSFVVH
ncbi:transporter, auxin efflux carrier (AEC) family protein [Providencia rettgeri DSM 1131]|uniref:AEC family transporter n=1 Tax=Providencia TaxID=586 RepID=UPI000197C7B6|nr:MULTISPECIES: AEC family transporter [Providencia]EFE55530.1 transporter, auxin efflux carrier (AEC) family protein [Providencia rettgeri DSM 1131]MCG9526167.1 AEC family transporter [Providencia rettgeri]QKG45158.1 AEC family transporter [Providencia rettgeri]QNN31393.1 AEC family transporter [Providencia rettgeri]QXA56140.1 AEC family transporter [Providencia rettgeri]